MKTKYKFVLLIIVAIFSSLFIYYNAEKSKEISKHEDILLYQENLEKGFLKDSHATFDNPKVILNPYGISPLTALIIFETNDLTAPIVTIEGKDDETTITKQFTSDKKHILPIYGLYPDTNNKVTIKVNNEVKTVEIKTEALPEDFILPTNVDANKDELDNKLYFVSPSAKGYVAAYDMNGDVRWYLTANYAWHLLRLKNGNLLVGSDRLVNPPYYTTGLLEIDLTGKIYYEYTLPGGYHHDVFEMPNGNLLIASNNFSNGTVEDYIVELDRTTGDIIKEFDLTKILPMEDAKSEGWIEYDWFHNNSVWYDTNTNSITLSGRHQDAIINIDYNTGSLKWILGDNTNWSEEYQKYFFKKDEDTEWQWSQHSAVMLENGDIFVFDNGNNRSKNKDEYINAEDNYSRGVIYRINTDDMTVRQIWQYGKERGSEFYSPYISNVEYYRDDHYLIHSGGHSELDGITQNQPAGLIQADELNSITVEWKDGEEIFEMELPSNFYRAVKMNLYQNNTFKLGKGKRLGSLGQTKTDGKAPILLFNKKTDKKYGSHNIKISKDVDRLSITGTFKKSDKVDIILKNVFTRKNYHMTISKRPYTAMCIDIFNQEQDKNGITVTKHINDEGLKGKYYIFIKINGTVYDPDLYVEF